MDNQNIPEKLELDEHSRFQLAEAARWSRFVGIAGMIMGILMMFGGIFLNKVLSGPGSPAMPASMMTSMVSAVYIILGLVFLLVSYFLLRFGSQAATALSFNRQDYLAHSFKNLKLVYKIIGILVISYLALAIIGVFFSFLSGGTR